MNRTKLALLGFLAREPMSGYDLKKAIEKSIANFWSESFGQIYPILRQLEAERLATRSSRATEGGRRRDVYVITARGRRELEQWLKAPTAPRPKRNEILLKLFFAARSDPKTAIDALERFRAEQAAHAEHYARIHETLAAEHSSVDLPYWLLTLDYGERETAAHLAWCDAALERLGTRRTKEARDAPRRTRRTTRR